MREDRAWMLLGSGRRLDLIDPQPDSWTDRDLAVGLSRTYRWGGHSCWNLPLSVAQHSLLVLTLREAMGTVPLGRHQARRELLHDAHEGLIGFDAITPLKPHLGEGFREVDRRLSRAVELRYMLPAWTPEEHALHKRADYLAAASEARHVVGWSAQDMSESLGITTGPLHTDPLPEVAGCRPWEPWPARFAAGVFLTLLRRLTGPDLEGFGHGDVASAVRHEAMLARLAAEFRMLPHSKKQKDLVAPAGSSLDDTYVTADACDWSQSAEGVVVAGERGEDGAWLFDEPFTLFTDDGLIECQGHNCDVY